MKRARSTEPKRQDVEKKIPKRKCSKAAEPTQSQTVKKKSKGSKAAEAKQSQAVKKKSKGSKETGNGGSVATAAQGLVARPAKSGLVARPAKSGVDLGLTIGFQVALLECVNEFSRAINFIDVHSKYIGSESELAQRVDNSRWYVDDPLQSPGPLFVWARCRFALMSGDVFLPHHQHVLKVYAFLKKSRGCLPAMFHIFDSDELTVHMHAVRQLHPSESAQYSFVHQLEADDIGNNPAYLLHLSHLSFLH